MTYKLYDRSMERQRNILGCGSQVIGVKVVSDSYIYLVFTVLATMTGGAMNIRGMLARGKNDERAGKVVREKFAVRRSSNDRQHSSTRGGVGGRREQKHRA